MTRPPTSAPGSDDAAGYEIRIQGHLDSRWTTWFEDLSLTRQPDGTTLLQGRVADQAALHGLLQRIRDLGLSLDSVTRQDQPANPAPARAPHPHARGAHQMITIESVTKSYGHFTAVDDVSFTAETGRVTGFLGPNGAGKSTTMRVLVGLTTPTTGHATIGGRRYHDLDNPGTEVGVLLDASAQHGGRTGREILAITQQVMGLPRRRVDEMLEAVSLTDTEARRRVRDYSLGMRQRLGIAGALMGDPEVLILDEPANGLDPAGIRWMRGLLRDFADRGGTVLLSSHLLHEIEVVADDLVVIGNGRIVAQGSKDDLLRTAGSHRPQRRAGRRSKRPARRRHRDIADGVRHPARPGRDPARGTDRLRRPASPSSSCALPRAPAWRRCSSSSPPKPNEKDESHEHVSHLSRLHRSPRPGVGAINAHSTLSSRSGDASPCVDW